MTSGGNNFNYFPENRLTKFSAVSTVMANAWGPKWLLNELATATWPMIDANISDQLPKFYLFNSLNRAMCGDNMSPYSVSGANLQPPNVFLEM